MLHVLSPRYMGFSQHGILVLTLGIQYGDDVKFPGNIPDKIYSLAIKRATTVKSLSWKCMQTPSPDGGLANLR